MISSGCFAFSGMTRNTFMYSYRMTICVGVWMYCCGKSPSITMRGSPAGRQRPVGSSMPRRLYASSTFFAAQGWYGAPSRPAGRSLDERVTGAVGSCPLPPTPRPRFASSHDPRWVLPPCHTPVRSGFPSAVRGTPDAVCADMAGTCQRAMAATAATMNGRITAPPRRDCLRRRRCPPAGRRTVSCRRPG